MAQLALARTAAWLTGQAEGLEPSEAGGDGPDGGPSVAYDGPGPWLAETDGPLGRLRHALPPFSFTGGPVNWSRPPGPWGADLPRWHWETGGARPNAMVRWERYCPTCPSGVARLADPW